MSGSDAMSEPRTSSRGSLGDRVAARAGYALTLDTELIRNSDISMNPQALMIPPGLSPTTLLDTPDFIPNSLFHPSPTTGKLVFIPCGNNQDTSLPENECNDKDEKEKTFEGATGSSFMFPTPVQEQTKASVNAEVQIHPSPTTGKLVFIPCGNNQDTSLPENELNNKDEKEKTFEDAIGSSFTFPTPVQEQTKTSVNAEEERSHPPLNEDGDLSNVMESDGYNWRKYGQKQVKASECPRSYYKCTNLNCPVKKKVERSLEGHVTEITYKGCHNHPKPPPNRRSNLSEMPQGSLARLGLERFNGPAYTTKYESGDFMDLSSFSSDGNDADGDSTTHGSASLGCDGEGDESESKRRKIESYVSDMSGASRPAIKEPRVVVQTTSDVDVLDDGYRWRKYGQKVVKGNPNPRSYYKCTSEHCKVRKHVERASNDLTSVITTYEGKHNHDVPGPRNYRPGPSQINYNLARFGQMSSMDSLAFPNQPQLGPYSGFGTGQFGLARLGLSGLGTNHGMLPPVRYPYLGEVRSTVPKAEAGAGSSSKSIFDQLA